MRKFLLLFLLIPMLFVSCKEAGDDVEKGFEVIKPFTLAIDGTTADNLSVLVDYSKSKASHPYVVGVVDSDHYEAELEAQGDEAIKEYVLEQLADKGVSPTKDDNKYVFSGSATVDLASAWELEAYKSYYVAVFAVDGSDKLLTNVEAVKSSAIAPLAQGNPYATLVSTRYNSIVVDVSMNGYEGNYYVALSSENQFERGYKGDPNEFVASLMAYEAEIGTDLSVVDNTYVFDADARVDLADSWICYGETDYYVIVFGIDGQGDLTSEISTLKTRSADFEQKPVELTVESAGSKGITFTTTAESDMPYIVFPMLKDQFIDVESFNSNATDLAGSIIYFILSHGIDPTAGTGGYSFIGSQESITFDPKTYGITPNTEYVMTAFHVDEDYCLASAPVIKDATTPKIEDTGARLGSITISDMTYIDAVATIDAGNYTGLYYAAPFLQEELNDVYDGDKDAMLNFMISYEMTKGGGFDHANNSNKLIGDATIHLGKVGWNIIPGCEYVMYAFGVAPNGTLLTEILESEPFTTPSVDHAAFTMDVHDICDNGAMIDYSADPTDVPYYRGYVEKSEVEGMSDRGIVEYLKFRDGFWDFHYESIFYGECSLDLTGVLEPNTEYYAVTVIYFLECGMLCGVNKEPFKTTGESLPEVVIPDEIIIPDVEFGTIDVSDIYNDEATLNVHPIDEDMTYLVMLTPATYFDRFESLEDALREDLTFYKNDADMSGKTFRRFLKEKLRSGEKRVGMCLPMLDKEYVVYVVGLDLDSCQPLTKIVTARFSNVGAPEYIAPVKSTEKELIQSCHPFGLFNGDAAVEEVQGAVISGAVKLQREEQTARKSSIVSLKFSQKR